MVEKDEEKEEVGSVGAISATAQPCAGLSILYLLSSRRRQSTWLFFNAISRLKRKHFSNDLNLIQNNVQQLAEKLSE